MYPFQDSSDRQSLQPHTRPQGTEDIPSSQVSVTHPAGLTELEDFGRARNLRNNREVNSRVVAPNFAVTGFWPLAHGKVQVHSDQPTGIG